MIAPILSLVRWDERMMATPVTTGEKFDAGKSAVRFQTTPRQPISFHDQTVYDVSREGQRFLILLQAKNQETRPMTVVLNWDAVMKK